MRTRMAFAILLILLTPLLILGNTALGQGPAIVQHSDTRWQAAYWNNTSLSGSPAIERTELDLDADWGTGSPDPAISADYFSARWTRYVDVTPDTYHFSVTCDDGIRVWVDGDLLIDEWRGQPATTYTASRYLGTGHHLIQVEYYEKDGVAVARFALIQGDAPGQWRGEYYNNRTLEGSPSLVRDDPQIDFTWGSASPAPGQINADLFSVRWTRNLDLPAGDYRFRITVDDGARLYVNGHTLIDAWKDQAAHTYTGDIYLSGGPVAVQMEYYESYEHATAQLTWEGAPSPPPVDSWETYSNPDFAITFKYPSHWELVPGYSDVGDKFAGSDGFFLITAMSGGTIDDVAANEAGHVLQPYGSHPTVESLWVQGQEARLILPSADQPLGMEHQSALIIRYPQPVPVSGYPCDFFVLYADEDHVRTIGETLSFVVTPEPVGTVVVDDTDAAFSRHGSTTGWRTALEGHDGHLTWTYNNDTTRTDYNYARWTPHLVAGRYEVFAYVPYRYTTTAAAHYWVSHRDGYTLQVVDQSTNGDRWVSLGTYWFRGTSDDSVSLSDVTYEPYLSRLIAFDAMKWEPR
jgi:hypothetical protein